MKFLLDACAASRTLRNTLSALGHDVRSARGELARASDEALLALAYEERRVLVTEDNDFGELVFGSSAESVGRIEVFLKEVWVG